MPFVEVMLKKEVERYWPDKEGLDKVIEKEFRAKLDVLKGKIEALCELTD